MDTKIFAKAISYQLVEFLGEGLNSCVYRAIKEDKEFGMSQNLAVKILKSEKLVSIWRNEISRMSALRSKYCVGYYGWDIISGKPALVLEHVRGLTLEELTREEQLTKAELREILAQSYCGLKDLEDASLFHGDLNLHNIMVDDSGTVKLVDFGVFDKEGALFVTPKYADPRVLAGQQPNIETDIYSLKAIGAELARKSKTSSPLEISEIKLNNSSQRSLALKICKIIEKKSSRQGFTQKLVQITRVEWNLRKVAQAITMICICSLPLFSRGDSQNSNVKEKCQISVRSKNWLEIKINGQKKGYVPVDIDVAGTENVLLEWESESGKGRTVLTPRPGEHIVLDDRFFSNSNMRNE